MILQDNEYLYAAVQPKPLVKPTGFIAHHYGELTVSGQGFYRDTEYYFAGLENPAYHKDFADTMNLLRDIRENSRYHGCLANKYLLRRYVNGHRHLAVPCEYGNEYVFRHNTAEYVYFIRLCPDAAKTHYHVYVYLRAFLERHMRAAQQGISFRDVHNKVEFTIADGDSIRITDPVGTYVCKQCRFVRDDEFCVGDKIYSTYEWPSVASDDRCEVIPLRNSLPEKCYWHGIRDGVLYEIQRGGDGMTVSVLNHPDAERNARMEVVYNRHEGITKRQFAAMEYGCQHSWAHPEADPANYTEDGIYKGKRTKKQAEQIEGPLYQLVAWNGIVPTDIVPQYWCNAMGELHKHGEKDITEDQLPAPLQRAYNELWSCGNADFLCYLVDTQNAAGETQYGIALNTEYDETTVDHLKQISTAVLNMEELLGVVKAAALCLYNHIPKEANATVLVGEYSGCGDCHELMVILPADVSVETFVEVKKELEKTSHAIYGKAV